tara:strand:- start:215 stop:535 length:321 start_codon:yes stop_codon:yes gene_type:complete
LPDIPRLLNVLVHFAHVHFVRPDLLLEPLALQLLGLDRLLERELILHQLDRPELALGLVVLDARRRARRAGQRGELLPQLDVLGLGVQALIDEGGHGGTHDGAEVL